MTPVEFAMRIREAPNQSWVATHGAVIAVLGSMAFWVAVGAMAYYTL